MSENPYEPPQGQLREDQRPKPKSTLPMTLLILAALTIVVLSLILDMGN